MVNSRKKKEGGFRMKAVYLSDENLMLLNNQKFWILNNMIVAQEPLKPAPEAYCPTLYCIADNLPLDTNGHLVKVAL